MKKAYISGQITGLDPDIAMAFFEKAERELTSAKFNPVNPMKLLHNHDKKWVSYMIEDLNELAKCDIIAMLPNWKNSNGAIIEHTFAKNTGKIIIYL